MSATFLAACEQRARDASQHSGSPPGCATITVFDQLELFAKICSTINVVNVVRAMRVCQS